MKCVRVIVCALFLIDVLCQDIKIGDRVSPETFDLEDRRVVGGSKAPLAAAPYQVSLRDEDMQHFCGGCILNKRWVITAAHCVVDIPPRYLVVGTNRIDHDGEKYDVKYVVSHPDYKSDTHDNDVALVKTVHGIAFNDRVRPALLPKANTKSNAVLVLTGWGKTAHPGEPAKELQYIKLKVISKETCGDRLKTSNISDKQICTYTKKGQGACHGDSGGPLVGGKYIVGVVSFGFPCAKGYPDVFSRVWSYRKWISKIIALKGKAKT